jgi:hypothetical protein
VRETRENERDGRKGTELRQSSGDMNFEYKRGQTQTKRKARSDLKKGVLEERRDKKNKDRWLRMDFCQLAPNLSSQVRLYASCHEQTNVRKTKKWCLAEISVNNDLLLKM